VLFAILFVNQQYESSFSTVHRTLIQFQFIIILLLVWSYKRVQCPTSKGCYIVHPHQTFKNNKYFISLKIKLVLNNYVAKMVKCSFLKEGRKIELFGKQFLSKKGHSDIGS
jgi:hypothetical protein